MMSKTPLPFQHVTVRLDQFSFDLLEQLSRTTTTTENRSEVMRRAIRDRAIALGIQPATLSSNK